MLDAILVDGKRLQLPQRQRYYLLNKPPGCVTSRSEPQGRTTGLDRIAQTLTDLVFYPDGTEGYAKAEVTVGGIDTADLSSRTMGARHVPGLYAIGEAVDVTGWLGGYNFQWAWSSGAAAGRAIAAAKGP